ncbi:MAG: hypothetical protein HY909_10070 [Deltaproteobacteria bacterium]|nr:hypothetical protein [Deltaproteobacteria bacterium]
MRRWFAVLWLFGVLGGCDGAAPPPTVSDAAADAPGDQGGDVVAPLDGSGDANPPPPDTAAQEDSAPPVDGPPPADASCGGAAQPCCPAGGMTPRCEAGLRCQADTCQGCEGAQTLCGGECVDTASSATHCGACGRACAAGELCSEGACQSACAPPGTLCMGACVRTQSDASHCGGCGMRCMLANATAACTDGACAVAACAEGFGDCDGMAANGCETDLRTSAGHCGACGRACSGGGAGTASCAMGTCGLTCATGLADCDGDPSNGCEADTRVNTGHCGRCGNACPTVAGGAACAAGVCGASACAAGTADCDGMPATMCETNTRTSLAHCGGCGRACARANATAACTDGNCALTACNAGFGDCDMDPNNGCETNLRTSAGHCGACGAACPSFAGAAVECAAGACRIAVCPAGTGNCDRMVANGCEVNTNTSTMHCGACGAACSFPRAAASCSSGACVLGACAAPYANCNGLTADGCEVNTSTSVAHCGGCGRRCALAHTATQTCAAGACGIGACAAGFGNCNGMTADGCETSTATSTRHCGMCGRACAAGEVCSAGACVRTCAPGQTNCSGTCASLPTDPSNCGMCGRVCSIPNATASCAAGACTVGVCASGFGNCDGNAANGCETNVATSTANCGACGRLCTAANGTGACVGSLCSVASCTAGFGNCNADPADGCESNLRTNPSHCNACGAACSLSNATSNCVAGVCGILSCNSGYGNCNGTTSDGCETNTNGTTSHCGRCGNACPARDHALASCSSGACGIVCNRDYGNCDGDTTNGCETHLPSSERHCGRCGNRCTGTCQRGICIGI